MITSSPLVTKHNSPYHKSIVIVVIVVVAVIVIVVVIKAIESVIDVITVQKRLRTFLLSPSRTIALEMLKRYYQN